MTNTSTCIIAYREKGVVYMAGDSAAVGNQHIHTRKNPKIFSRDGMLFGYTSSFRMGNILRYRLKLPEKPESQDTYEYMCTDFVDTVRKCFGHFGYATTQNGQEFGGQFLVGFEGRIFDIQGDFQVGEPDYPYFAVGCGRDLALGAMHAMRSMEMPPKRRLLRAMESACEFSSGVGSPFHVVSSPSVDTEKL